MHRETLTSELNIIQKFFAVKVYNFDRSSLISLLLVLCGQNVNGGMNKNAAFFL